MAARAVESPRSETAWVPYFTHKESKILTGAEKIQSIPFIGESIFLTTYYSIRSGKAIRDIAASYTILSKDGLSETQRTFVKQQLLHDTVELIKSIAVVVFNICYVIAASTFIAVGTVLLISAFTGVLLLSPHLLIVLAAVGLGAFAMMSINIATIYTIDKTEDKTKQTTQLSSSDVQKNTPFHAYLLGLGYRQTDMDSHTKAD